MSSFSLCSSKELFTIYMNIAANATSTFTVDYEELIYREQSLYRKTITINPGDIVDNLSASIRVKEPEGFSSYSTSDFASIDVVSSEEIVCQYSASVDTQRAASSDGVSLIMSCEYDVVHPIDGAGNFAVNGGYFAQFFSPVVTNTLRINLVLVIDVSGSMEGRKIEQARQSLVALLHQLHNDDLVAIVTFSSEINQWKSDLVRVGNFRTDAIRFARNLRIGGSTALDGGLQTGISMLKRSAHGSFVKVLVLLTDGQPNVGISDPRVITDRAQEATLNTGISVNSISFGFYADFEFLQDLALLNSGIATRIAESENAAEELAGFLREIATPALAEVVVTFPVGSVEKVTSLEFPLLFSGSEIVVSGKFSESSPENITVQVKGQGIDNTVTYESTISTVSDTTIAGSLPSTERLRAYLKIKDLLNEKRVAEINGENSSSVEREALQLSLDYNFVTELTSLIVVEEMFNMTTDNHTNSNDYDNADTTLLTSCPNCYYPQYYYSGRGGIQVASLESTSSEST